MPNLSILLSAVLSTTDTVQAPNATIFTRNLNNPTLPATVAFHDEYFQAAAGGSAVTLPSATVWVVYVKNLHATINLNVAWIPAGSVTNTFVCVPGGLFIYFQPTEGAGGVTSLTLTAASGTVPAEVLVAS